MENKAFYERMLFENTKHIDMGLVFSRSGLGPGLFSIWFFSRPEAQFSR